MEAQNAWSISSLHFSNLFLLSKSWPMCLSQSFLLLTRNFRTFFSWTSVLSNWIDLNNHLQICVDAPLWFNYLTSLNAHECPIILSLWYNEKRPGILSCICQKHVVWVEISHPLFWTSNPSSVNWIRWFLTSLSTLRTKILEYSPPCHTTVLIPFIVATNLPSALNHFSL